MNNETKERRIGGKGRKKRKKERKKNLASILAQKLPHSRTDIKLRSEEEFLLTR